MGLTVGAAEAVVVACSLAGWVVPVAAARCLEE